MSDRYHEANTIWPETIPPLTREEARRAAKRLMFRFTKRRNGWGRERRVWISNDSNAGSLRRGWRRLVHDVSHRANLILYPTVSTHRHHNGQHAEIETDMVRHVLASGWLDGKLRPKVRAKPTIDKAARLRKRLVRWESKRKRAETAIKKLTRSLRYHERKASARTD